MRVLIVGATGTIGSAVAQRLSARHEIVRIGHHGGDHQVDLARPDSINALYESIGPFDAVVGAAGVAKFGPLDELRYEDYQVGLANKLMGQVNLVRLGLRFIRDRGSFTLTSGVLSQEPMKGSTSISMVNAALEGFVRAASLELPRGVRVNAVSPPWITATLKALNMDPSIGMAAAEVAHAYIATVEGDMTGRIIDPRKPLPR